MLRNKYIDMIIDHDTMFSYDIDTCVSGFVRFMNLPGFIVECVCHPPSS